MTTLAERHAQIKVLENREKYEKLRYFQPYPKQLAFFAAGLDHSERLLKAGNRCGKSECAAFEIACHATGLYPPWWPGRRFEKAPRIWCAGTAGVSVRNIIQGKLCGEHGVKELWGTGFIPKATFVGEPTTGRMAPEAYDTIRVRHVSGGISIIGFKTYTQEREDWQGDSLDVLWCDEEPPLEMYVEGQARLIDRGGMSFLTFTSLKGETEVIRRFYEANKPQRIMINMTMAEAPHLSPAMIEQALSAFPRHEHEARMNGGILLGEGSVFQTPPEDLYELLNGVPDHWAKLWGIDIGIAHPFAAVLCAHDREKDIFHVLNGFKMTGAIAMVHAGRMREIAANATVAWPHDATQREKGSGETIASVYKRHGLQMMSQHATHPDGGYSTEAGIMGMDDAMRMGKFKVNRDLTEWFTEYRGYHRKDGQIVKLYDDLMSATRIAYMMRRFAKAGDPTEVQKRRPSGQTLNPFTGQATLRYDAPSSRFPHNPRMNPWQSR